jgi:hypothetical protein
MVCYEHQYQLLIGNQKVTKKKLLIDVFFFLRELLIDVEIVHLLWNSKLPCPSIKYACSFTFSSSLKFLLKDRSSIVCFLQILTRHTNSLVVKP